MFKRQRSRCLQLTNRQTPAVSPEEAQDSEEESPRMSSELAERFGSEEEEASAEVGSTGSLDVINVDTDRDETRATGHMGKSSAVAWAKRTAEECQQNTDQGTVVGKHGLGFTLASYHTEDADVLAVDTSNVNPYDWPDSKLADMLLQSYFDHVHRSLPILDKARFVQEYNTFRRGSSDISSSDIIFLGTLNAIFAISSVYAQCTRDKHKSHYNDHLIYCARAKLLCMDQGLLYQDARVSTTRCLGLLCLYYITTCRLNR